jgi:hypothetical protein
MKEYLRFFLSNTGKKADSDSESDAEKRRAHLIANFRTITTLIHSIDPTFLSDSKSGRDKQIHSTEDIRALRILTALAIAISRKADVSAVVTSDHRSLENGQFRVIASHHQFFALRNPQSVHPKLEGRPSTSGVSTVYELLTPSVDPSKLNGKFLDIQ